jgi:KDO2-lipid IV(A) lauroyltransferase
MTTGAGHARDTEGVCVPAGSSFTMTKPRPAASMPTQTERRDRLHRLRRLNKLLSLVPYGLGATVIALATRNPLVQALFRGHRRRLSGFLRENGLTIDKREVFARYLTTNWLSSWRLSALARCSDDAFDRSVSVTGYEAFAKLREQGRPVLLCNSHYGSGKMILLALMRQGHTIHSLDRQDVFSFSNIRARGELISINLGDRQCNFMLKQVFRARKVLQEGGILHIAGDGVRGLSGRAIPFLRRQRRFPASVAELALATNAAVAATFGTVDTDGRIRLELLPPLEMPDPKFTHEERVMRIIEQYRSLLQEHWLACPGAIHKGELKNYADLPRQNATTTQNRVTG